jgi:hypothetical protein
MGRFIAEFVLDSDIKLPEDAAPVEWVDPGGQFQIVFRNEKSGFSYIDEVVSAQLTFDAIDLDQAKERSQDLLASALNSLVWVSMSMVRQAKLIRVVDWDPGKVMRDAFIFSESPRIAVPEPILVPELIETAAALHAAQQNDRAQSALRWFRLGIGGSGIEEQFTYLWFALETAAEALKQPGKVRSKCPVCEGDLYCEVCNDHPEHRRFAADAIRDLIVAAYADEHSGREAFKVLTKIRHTLMHGRRMASVESSLPYDTQRATNELAQIARDAIWKLSDFSGFKAKEMQLNIVDVQDVIRGRLIMAARVQTVYGSDPENPVLGDRSGLKINIIHPGQPAD